MSSIATLNGVQYIVPAYNDTGWAQGTGNLSQYLVAIAANTLQPTGGSFTLTADVDFGANFGLKALFLKTETANPASAGVLRLASADTIKWRNNANGADIALSKDTSDNLQYNATKVLLSGAVVNADINASAAIAYSKLALTGSIVSGDLAGSVAVNKLVALTVSRAVATDASGFLTVATTTAAELAFVSGVTSAIQTQLNAKQATLTAGQLPGTATNDDAAAGKVGEYIPATWTTFTSPATGTFGDATSISLTAGDWDIEVHAELGINEVASVTRHILGVSTTSGNSATGLTQGTTRLDYLVPGSNSNMAAGIGRLRASLSSTTIYYVKVSGTFSGTAPTSSGIISARRTR